MNADERRFPVGSGDRVLLDNVRPEGRKNPDPPDRYQLVVIGAGSAGLVAAAGAATLGVRVALIERDRLGGDCLNSGCVPSKALLKSSRQAVLSSRSEKYGLMQVKGEVDFGRVMERMRDLRARISTHDSVERFASMGVDVYFGEACFMGPDRLDVGGTELVFSRAILATGTRPAIPPVEGLREVRPLTNETVFDLAERPDRLLVIGGGPIGCELSQAFKRLGCQVALLQRGDRLLPREDPDATKVLTNVLRRDGVDIRFSSELKKVRVIEGTKEALVVSGDNETWVGFDEVLVAAGRVPELEPLNLAAAGVEADASRGILVDDRLRTSNPRIYAAGDACFRYRFTHTADATARLALQNALFMGRRKTTDLVIPWCTYTEPEIAHTGLNDQEAKEKGLEVMTLRVELSDVDRPVLEGEDEGFLKVHAERRSGRILGATLVASHAGDMISELTLAIVAGLSLKDLSGVIHPYPTQAEIIRRAADEFNRARLTPGVMSILKKWLDWRY